MWIGLMECRSFQELADSTLPLKNGCGHVFIASWIPTAKACFCPKCKMESLIAPQYGMMLKHLQSEIPRNPVMMSESISLPLGFRRENNRARILALQVLEKAWKESEADYSSRWKKDGVSKV